MTPGKILVFGTKGLLIFHYRANPLYEVLDFTFNWVLLLMTRRGGLNSYVVRCFKMTEEGRIIFCGAGVTTKSPDVVTMGRVEGDYVRDSTAKSCRRFVPDHSAMNVAAVFVTKDVETSESPY